MNKIVNPITNRKVSIHSKLGKSILNKYINEINRFVGGSNQTMDSIDVKSVHYLLDNTYVEHVIDLGEELMFYPEKYDMAKKIIIENTNKCINCGAKQSSKCNISKSTCNFCKKCGFDLQYVQKFKSSKNNDTTLVEKFLNDHIIAFLVSDAVNVNDANEYVIEVNSFKKYAIGIRNDIKLTDDKYLSFLEEGEDFSKLLNDNIFLEKLVIN
tara:strand:- start:4995 stop:5630 length:636 start_codon:yes stop_codon:yes gene_type:complete